MLTRTMQRKSSPFTRAVISAVPLDTAVTMPLESTVATALSEEDQRTSRFVASEGDQAARERSAYSAVRRLTSVLFRVKDFRRPESVFFFVYSRMVESP